MGMDLCDYDYMSYNYSQSYQFSGYYWTSVPGVIKAKINPSDYVAIVRNPSNFNKKV